jgi:hypothetical protein
LHPDFLTRRFHRLVELSGLPPVRLHDLRHGAATLAHATGADLKPSKNCSDTPASAFNERNSCGSVGICLTHDAYVWPARARALITGAPEVTAYEHPDGDRP